MTEKVLIFDSSSLISMAMNGLLGTLRELKKIFDGKFIIPYEVKSEIIDKPKEIKRFEFEALQLEDLISTKVLELPGSIGLNKEEILKQTYKYMEIANSSFIGQDKKPIHLIDLGETACLVISKMLTDKKIKNVVLVDERTTRMLCERPENLKKLLQKKLHIPIKIKGSEIKTFREIKIARSTELIYIAFKKGLIKIKDKKILDALLYALKYKGCAISNEEIERIKKIA